MMKLFTKVELAMLSIAFLCCADAVAQPGAAQDLCANVVPVELAQGDAITLSGNSTSATPDGDFQTGSPFNGASVMWHAFTITECMNISFNFCEQEEGWLSWGFLFDECPSLEYRGPDQFNELECANGNLTYYHYTVPPGTYYIGVPQNGASIGAYSFELSGSGCGNDHCQDVTPVDLVADPVAFGGDNTGATHENDWAEGNPFGAPNVLTPAVWHAVNIGTCAEIHIAYCGTDPMFDEVFGFISNSCPADEMFVHVTSYTCTDGNQVRVYSGLASGTYYIPVVPFASGTGPYQLTVTGIDCNVSVRENDALQWTVFPNPARNSFELSNGGRSDVMFAEIVDLSGRVVATHNRRISVGATAQFDVSSLSHGVYVVRISTADGLRSEQRLVIN